MKLQMYLRFDEDHSDYDPTDSDEDYTENEKILLNKVRNKQTKNSDSEVEVFGVGSGSDDDDQSDLAVSDIEGQEDDELPDVRAWGKKKNKFYHTDYVDQDYGGFQGKDAHLAELEEEEARNLQQQLAQQLDDDDFRLDVPSSKKIEDEDEKIPEELIKSDISKLSKRQRLQILQKESPEFFGLVEDFEVKMTVARDYLKPILEKFKKGQIPKCSGVDFVITHHQLILNYCINIYMYLLLKASRVNVQNHPVIKRLYQYRQLLSQLTPVFEEKIKPLIESVLEEKVEKQKKTLKVLSKLTEKKEKKKTKKRSAQIENEKLKKKVKFDEKVTEHKETDSKEEQEENETVEPSEETEVGKRAITYQIAKNKGLTPHRKKDQRNPRVKHRNKFKKAKIRRRGAVREPRTEMTRYGGEISGIKANVSKSIKLKS